MKVFEKLNNLNKKNQIRSNILKIKDKNNLLFEMQSLLPFVFKKGNKKKMVKIFEQVINQKDLYSNKTSFNTQKFLNLYEMLKSNTPYVNVIELKSRRKQNFNTVPIKKTVQKRFKANWLIKNFDKKNSKKPFVSTFVNELKTWETNKEKLLNTRNDLYKLAVRHNQD